MSIGGAAKFRDSLGRFIQDGTAVGVRLIRITGEAEANRYPAEAVEFDEAGATRPAGGDEFEVVNLAEPADEQGAVPPGMEAIAIDVEGRQVVFIRRDASGAAATACRVVEPLGGAAYLVRRQQAAGAGQFTDAPGAADITAHNLAELTLGPGAAVDAGTIVMVWSMVQPAEPPIVRYVFDHPVYAKYLD